ncbi:acyl-CoA dehydrogenase [Rhodococcus ruber Chol-4]|uniref:Acyl-CoA dehydrogenase n=1 Tax=Rhodococcus ruber TaxID=1830 RepID=A0A098BHQ3_9NOCA|nr:acyl-CoA dehydrogenase family protein [Rhodococcus ruber]MDO2377621.1 acyl-CoA dehydrogenase family protein [Rhodococcus ruber]AWH00716.1 acyl-CoA dehydrogenase [Rhodococcus ruber]KXF85858.1 acyl-CoA dehydrogenase [Rhodococcus ruber Chol-4]MBD8053745.1 acyl-CoA/acyl-ACP dehydrogenase [Rhodococcus ruber]MBP2213259.1 alkylation response protein AidB-like acyl-CoA dehydrogenase [Rhodococcus ruber]
MDFNFSEEQEAIRGLAHEVFTGKAGIDRVKQVELGDERVDRELWRELATTGLLGVALPEELGGGGLGLSELYVLLEQQGRHVAPVPIWQSVLAALAVVEFGTDAQRTALVPGVADGSRFLTIGLEEFGPYVDGAPATTATETGGGWHLTGAKAAVPVTHVAERAIVSATTPAGAALFVVDLAGDGVTVEQTQSTTWEICGNVTFDAAPAELLGPADGTAVQWLLDRVELALAALQLGVGAGAVEQAVTYLNGRMQFGRPLATFQAVGHQLADCYIDLEAMRVTLWQAAWLLTEGADPGTSVLVAKWWATDGGQRVVHRTTHVHGGMGVDTDYPVHRHLLWGKQIGATLGGSASDLARLGAQLAAGVEVVA